MTGVAPNPVIQRKCLLVLVVLDVDIEKYFHSFVMCAFLPILKSPI